MGYRKISSEFNNLISMIRAITWNESKMACLQICFEQDIFIN